MKNELHEFEQNFRVKVVCNEVIYESPLENIPVHSAIQYTRYFLSHFSTKKKKKKKISLQPRKLTGLSTVPVAVPSLLSSPLFTHSRHIEIQSDAFQIRT